MKTQKQRERLLELVNQHAPLGADKKATIALLKDLVADQLEIERDELDEFYYPDSEDITVMDLHWLVVASRMQQSAVDAMDVQRAHARA